MGKMIYILFWFLLALLGGVRRIGGYIMYCFFFWFLACLQGRRANAEDEAWLKHGDPQSSKLRSCRSWYLICKKAGRVMIEDGAFYDVLGVTG